MSCSSRMKAEHRTLICLPFIKDALRSAKHFKTHPMSAKSGLANAAQAFKYINNAFLGLT